MIDVGETYIPREVFDEFLVDISPRFTMQTYNLLRHNCNNFSNEVANFLVGASIPQHILDLPDDVLSTPFGQQMMPMLNMMDAQMRNATEQGGGGGGGGGQFGAWTPPPSRTTITTITTTTTTAAPAMAPASASEPSPWKPSDPAAAAGAAAAARATTTTATTTSLSSSPAAADAKAALEVAIKAEFTRLVAQGMSPNEAAAEAVNLVKARAQ